MGALWWVADALVAGPTPVPDAILACDDLLTSYGRDHGGVQADLGLLWAMRGEFDRARQLANAARTHIREGLRGVKRALTFVEQRSAEVELMAGDDVAAERQLRLALELAFDVGERDQVAQIAGLLSRILSSRGDLEEAEQLAAVSVEQSPAESVTSQALSRTALALVTAERGDHIQAERLAREAVGLAPVDMLNLRGSLLVDLACVLSIVDRGQEAKAVLAEAAFAYERKGNLIGVSHVGALLG